jgi:hypothetical protein
MYMQAKTGLKASKPAAPMQPGIKAVWKSNMMLGISDLCLNPSNDLRVEAALGLRLAVLLYSSDGKHPSPLARDGGGGGVDTDKGVEEEGVMLGSVCISLGELARKPRGGPIETTFALSNALGSAGAIHVRLWAQRSGLEGGRCVHISM